MSRSYVFWPKLDIAIEETVKSCRQCVNIKSSPPAAPLTPWIWPAKAAKQWQRIHVDFAAYEGNHYLVVVDAHLKWPEVIGPMKSTTAGSAINALRGIFDRYSLPEQVVSDNGPPFQSVKYDDFLKQNGIQRVLVSPYHPASNGQAERFVQTFKNYLKMSSAQSCLLQRIQNFLLSYRGTPHSTTDCSSVKLFLQRELRTRLSLVKPDTASDSPPSPPLLSKRSEPIPGNLGSSTDTQVFPTSSTCTSSTESTPTAAVVPQPESMDRNIGPSELAQGTLGNPSIVTSPTIKLRRSSRTIKPPKRLIEQI
ncbi:Uncharacterized protein K02A2.6 [Paramuricea clavata]|uniref:Uncharacterized protein K02A2.6 n=1 Tax=Paramuricea clavata TaxID=317549 RepID=A0A6S7H0S7_PARCT|nr:Uncharacterized protein K02A2.6 [Paramuricea clavata]